MCEESMAVSVKMNVSLLCYVVLWCVEGRTVFFPRLRSYGVLTSNSNELPVRAFATGCWCWVPVLALVLALVL